MDLKLETSFLIQGEFLKSFGIEGRQRTKNPATISARHQRPSSEITYVTSSVRAKSKVLLMRKPAQAVALTIALVDSFSSVGTTHKIPTANNAAVPNFLRVDKLRLQMTFCGSRRIIRSDMKLMKAEAMITCCMFMHFPFSVMSQSLARGVHPKISIKVQMT
jgi:hypothetical protein